MSNAFVNQTINAVKILYQDLLGLDWDSQIWIKKPGREQHMPDILSKENVLRMVEVTASGFYRIRYYYGILATGDGKNGSNAID